MQTKYLFYVLLVSTFMLAIAGCGGGGGGGSAAGAAISSIPDNPPPPSQTSSVTLTWDAPTTNSDGSPLTDLDRYKIYYGLGSGNYTLTATIDKQYTNATISSLTAGTWCFGITAFDTSGNESSYSSEECITI